MRNNWTAALHNSKFRIHLALSILGLAAFALSLPYYFNHILLNKPGVQLYDSVLFLFTPKDWSTEIFVALYCCAALSVILNIKNPKTILLGTQIYVVVNFMRMISLYLFTLEAPQGIIPLNDPFLTHIAYGQPVYVKDLFFSGHITTLFLLFLVEDHHLLKWILLFATITVAVMLAWQRVHYTIDMLAAPLVTWLVFRFFRWFNQQVVFKEM
jgi:hypothetical protein